MKAFALVGFAVLALCGALAGTALARGDDWTPVPAIPFDWQCGATTVHVTFPGNNKEYEQVTTEPNGTLLLKVTGDIKVNLATDAGASLSFNASGPSNRSMLDPATGTLHFVSTGTNFLFLTPDQSAATGLPEMSLTKGPVDFLAYADGTMQVNRLDLHTLTDLCQELTG